MSATADLPKEAILIVNAMSRKGADVFEEARDKLTAAGVRLIDSHAVHEPEEMEPTVKAAIAKKRTTPIKPFVHR